MNAPSRFDTVLDTSREAYLTSNLGRIRKALAKVSTLMEAFDRLIFRGEP